MTARRILFSGSIAGHSVGYGGDTWAFLQWILGFRRLGFDVYYVEERPPQQCMDEDGKPTPFMETANARYFREVIDRFDLGDHAALLEAGSPPTSACRARTSARSRPTSTSSSTSLVATPPFSVVFAAACTSTWTRAIRRSGRRSTA